MPLEDQINQDLKQAMLAKEELRVSVLRSLKSSLLYFKVAEKLPRDQQLNDQKVEAVLAKESKKRQESADLYAKGGSQDRAESELAEKAIIDAYLPQQLSETELQQVVDQVIGEVSPSGPQDMGKVIGLVKQRVGVAADGSVIAKLVKTSLQ